tara:strand:+ start:743 stop:1417 length:675 start_codon:yes stop_codon:yes gene_type:complete
MKILAIIPARGGSKGIPNKNMKLFSGKPLIEWTIISALQSKFIDRVFISTDDHKIANFAENLGIKVPFLRDPKLSLDKSYIIDTVLSVMKKFSTYESMILLQPTSPLRTSKDIDSVIKIGLEKNFQSVVSIAESIYAPQLFYSLSKKKTISPLIKTEKAFNRQDFPLNYVINGACYFANKEFLFKNKKFITDDTIGYVMPQERSIDIDTHFDWKIAQFLHKSNN